jgi:hypothetical protein
MRGRVPRAASLRPTAFRPARPGAGPPARTLRPSAATGNSIRLRSRSGSATPPTPLPSQPRTDSGAANPSNRPRQPQCSRAPSTWDPTRIPAADIRCATRAAGQCRPHPPPGAPPESVTGSSSPTHCAQPDPPSLLPQRIALRIPATVGNRSSVPNHWQSGWVDLLSQFNKVYRQTQAMTNPFGITLTGRWLSQVRPYSFGK